MVAKLIMTAKIMGTWCLVIVLAIVLVVLVACLVEVVKSLVEKK